MPISQKTILAIYGDLCDLVEKLETLYNQTTQPGLFDGPASTAEALSLGIGNLLVSAREIHADAITHIMADDREIKPNPITGRLDE